MATAGVGRAGKGASQAPARSARPCSATASRSAGRAGAKTSPRPLSPAPGVIVDSSRKSTLSDVDRQRGGDGLEGFGGMGQDLGGRPR